jgi:hypothetical protein
MERTDGGRRARVGPLLLSAALATLLAACTSSGQPDKTASHHATTSSPGSTPTSAVPTTTLPALAASGPLAISANVAVPIAANVQITAAEAPDGSVFVAPESHDSPTPTVVWVVDGNTPAAIAEHVAGGVSALAADSANLYVVSGNNVLGYSRSTGNQMGQWNLPPINTANTSNAELVSMDADGGVVLITVAQGDLEYVYRFDSTSTAAPRLIAQGTSAAFGPNGSVYYERSDDHLVELSAAGVTTVGPLLVHAPNGAGGGIANVEAVAGGLVWVSEPAGQGLDTQLSPYDATTLQPMGTFSGSVTEQIVDTGAGPLVLAGPDGPGVCPQGGAATSSSCVFRLSPTAALTDPTSVGSAEQLLGPYPAVLSANSTTNDLVLERVS